MRLPFNAVCIFSAWLAWTVSNDFTVAIDERPPAYIHDDGALSSLIFGFIILNIAYSLVYAVEFIVLARSSQTWSRIARLALFCVGCIIGFVIAGRGASSIAKDIATNKWMQIRIQQQMEENKTRMAGWQPAVEQAADLVLPYGAFGPQSLSHELIGWSWWQWQPCGGDDPSREYPIKVVVYWNQTLEQIKKKYPVDEPKEQDYRYVEFSIAVSYLEKSIKDIKDMKLEEIEFIASDLERTLNQIRDAKRKESGPKQNIQ